MQCNPFSRPCRAGRWFVLGRSAIYDQVHNDQLVIDGIDYGPPAGTELGLQLAEVL